MTEQSTISADTSAHHMAVDAIRSTALPAAGEPVTFGTHIKPLFRARDRQSMRFAFDLWSYADVKSHAEAIVGQLSAGSMPCDALWPAERVDIVQRSIDSYMSE